MDLDEDKRSRGMKKILAFISAILLSATAFGDGCSQLLEQGIYNISSNYKDVGTASSFAQWFCDQRFSSKQQADNFGSSLGFPFHGIPVKFGFSSGSDGFQKSYAHFCASYRNDSSLREKLISQLKTVSGAVLKAFNSCTNSTGLHVWLERTYDPKIFIFASKFNPPNAADSFAKINTFDAGKNVSCHPIPRIVDSSGFRSRCTRSNDKPVSILINASWSPKGGGDLSLPAIAQYNPPPAPPAPPVKKAIAGLTDILNTLMDIHPGSSNIKEWDRIRNSIVNSSYKSDYGRFRDLVSELTKIHPSRSNELEWSHIRATSNEIIRDWNTVDKQKLFDMFLRRLSTIVPGSENKAEWARIRRVSKKIMRTNRDR